MCLEQFGKCFLSHAYILIHIICKCLYRTIYSDPDNKGSKNLYIKTLDTINTSMLNFLYQQFYMFN